MAIHSWKSARDAARNAGRPIPAIRRLVGASTALLVVDMQRAFLDVGAAIEVPDGRELVQGINILATRLRRAGGVVVFFRYVVGDDPGLLATFESRSYIDPKRESPLRALSRGHPQFEIHPELQVRRGDIVMEKVRYSAVLGSPIVEILRRRRVTNAIVTGVTTDVCAGNTAECLMQSGFRTVVAWDGTAALSRLTHELSLARMFCLYADVMPISEIVSRVRPVGGQ
jgi:ureidoacrylate peracid hydrolase